MTDRGIKVNFQESCGQVVDKKERVVAVAVKRENLYYLSFNPLAQQRAGVNVIEDLQFALELQQNIDISIYCNIHYYNTWQYKVF